MLNCPKIRLSGILLRNSSAFLIAPFIPSENSTVIEPTSGNTGVALAALCAAKGLRAVIVMPDNFSVERRKLVAAYGAQVVLTRGCDVNPDIVEYII